MTDVDEAVTRSVGELLDVLDLRSTGPGRLVGTSMSSPPRRVYGGQLVAQAYLAVVRGVADRPETFLPHSVHCTFLAPAVPGPPLEYVVRPLRVGASFARYEVRIAQEARDVGLVVASFHRPGAGYAHATAALPNRPPGDGELQGQFSDPDTGDRLPGPVEVRELPPPSPAPGPADPTELWVRVPHRLPDDPALHDAVLLYLSDARMLRSMFRAHGVDRSRTRTASLDHAVWLHRRARADDWLAYRTTSPWAGAGRAVGTGTLVDAAGEQVATTAQEMAVRPQEPV